MRFLPTLLLALGLSHPPIYSQAQPSDARSWFHQAQEHFQKQQWEEARQAALKALQHNPQLGDAELLLGLIATAQSQLQHAEQHFLKAIALQPNDYRAHGYLGSTYFRQKRFPEARSALEKVLELNPDNGAAHYNLGLMALAENDPPGALQHFEAVHRNNPSDVPALIGLLESALLLGDKFEAGKSARKLQNILPADDPRLFHAASLLAAHGDYNTALPLLEKIKQASPGAYAVNYNLALAYMRSGRYEEAAETLRPIVKPTGPAEAYNLLGFIEAKRQRGAEALEALRKAAELEAGNEDYRFDYAAELLQRENIESAHRSFSGATQDFPGSWRMRLGLGAVAYIAGDYEEAARELLEAVDLQPDAQLPYYLLGKTYDAAPSLQGRIRIAFEKYLQQKPKDAWAYYHHATILYADAAETAKGTGYDPAKESLQRALALNPSFAEAYLQLGVIAQSEGQFQESVTPLERAAQLAPTLAATHYRLGLAHQKAGNREKAKREMALFQKLRSEDRSAQDKAAILESLAAKTK